ncbi:hypothetical protein O181_034987 [Austropuccinia psidii MF-1]|uniref:Reverse transcriptase Ty1/copia-type domain-containing protein n=1 Tax=Austropuccinia psidii MF-1 TaxID=1389203 RepID=A0A9Q3D7R7_9BASI|nr:hypothetical protein [Austropuccinia psidii MF-1]
MFGCCATISIPRSHQEWKFGPAGEAGVLLEYENDNSTYQILQICNKKVLVSKHVRFDKSDFPSSKNSPSPNTFRVTRDGEVIDLGKADEACSAVTVDVVDEAHTAKVVQAESVDEICSADLGHNLEGNSRRVDEIPLPLESDYEPHESITNSRPTQIRVFGPRNPTIICGDIDQGNILTYSRRPKAPCTRSDDVPKPFRSSLKGPSSNEWSKEIEKELTSMVDLNVWDVMELKPDYKLVITTWVFQIKTNHLKEVTEHKAQLCAQGLSQTPGVDLGKTYSPMGRLNSLRCLIFHSGSNGIEFHQVDINSAFLNAPLDNTAFLSIPQGLEIDNRRFCLCLKKAIYGLKQAPLAWYDCLKAWLCPDVSIIKAELNSEFKIKDIGLADLILGIKVTHCLGHVSLDQGHFIESLLKLYGMGLCKTVATPLLPNTHLILDTEQEKVKFEKLGVNYCSAIGSMNYLSIGTRPDLSHAVSSLSQFLEKPGFLHWQAFLHILRYLKGTPNVGLVYYGGGPTSVEAYSNADWGNCPETQRSITGYLATFGGNLVLCKTRKQPSVSILTAEVEYKALCDLVSELLWLRQWCHEWKLLDSSSMIPIHEHKQGCINTINEDCNVNNKEMKHVDIQLHFVKEVVKSGAFKLTFFPAHCMLADFLTKSIARPLLVRSLYSLGVISLGVRGSVEKSHQNQFDLQPATPILTKHHNHLS